MYVCLATRDSVELFNREGLCQLQNDSFTSVTGYRVLVYLT